MEPSTTKKSLLPFVLVPVTLHTSAPALATMLRPGSMIMVSPSSSMAPRTALIRSAGEGMISPLQSRLTQLSAAPSASLMEKVVPHQDTSCTISRQLD